MIDKIIRKYIEVHVVDENPQIWINGDVHSTIIALLKMIISEAEKGESFIKDFIISWMKVAQDEGLKLHSLADTIKMVEESVLVLVGFGIISKDGIGEDTPIVKQGPNFPKVHIFIQVLNDGPDEENVEIDERNHAQKRAF